MIKTKLAFTAEIDDVDLAVSEITSQLNLEGGLGKNSAGLLSFYPDFQTSGVIKALGEKLPFRMTGATTFGNAVPGSHGDMLLTLMVLTSDEVSFDLGLSDPIAGGQSLPAVKTAYEEAAAASPGDPKVIITFFPMGCGVGVDFLVDALTGLAPGIPVFGTVAAEPNTDYSKGLIAYDGEVYLNRCSIVMVKGAVASRFFLASISKEKLFKDKAVVTSIEGNILNELNHTPAVEYLGTNMGLTRTDDGRLLQAEIFPLVADFNDGTPPILRAMLGFTDDRKIILASNVPMGASLSVGLIDSDEVLHTTKKLLEEIAAAERPDCLLIFSCTARLLALGLLDQGEINAASSVLGGSIPYMLAYAGGEICPVADESGQLTNRMHNYTFIVCAL